MTDTILSPTKSEGISREIWGAPLAAPTIPPQESESPHSRGLVLVVDDDADIRDLVAFKLQRAGLQVVVASDGNSALDAMTEHLPDVILLDVMMPGLSGLDVLRHIRQDEHLEALRVVLLTARSRDVDIDNGFSGGADDYVTKPFSPRELLHRVNVLLARGR